MTNNDINEVWSGRADPEDGDDGLRLHQVVQAYSNAVAPGGTTLIGFASDLGVQHNQGRVGAQAGPQALRSALANIAWHGASPVYDAGNITVADNTEVDALSDAQTDYATAVYNALCNQQFVLGLGGGHEIAWGSYQGCRHYLDHCGKHKSRIGILNFDAHFDLRKPPVDAPWAGSSGTPFYQVAQDCAARELPFKYACLGVSRTANTRALFNTADKLKVPYLLDSDFNRSTSESLINQFIAEIDYLYVTVCLDALPASVAPGVSAPAANGVRLTDLLASLTMVSDACDKHSVRWLMADIAELNPKYDIDQRTAKTAARIVYDIIELNLKAPI
ncbi:formimidoylglutamase [Arenicella xantha]|uniref:Formimidoylglutamase n=1 Tax=Arenicella xantha TaxID=644221 RepID=A0A395JMZ2_9GAMM|nr:formimidoylglutamase [Arenicella xantha]RBP53034.1 formiminoglutamase [Arenicella xantha]